ncbi:amino acid adenylation domain-containing protein [Nocardia salmonicida]|uniref:amino acid adenylation domain-containing protein n=1 Tax=Nocardia salmonicida TaxID=53431 RepID=UPI0020D26B55|nr:non-ribosomal peptide synthetase [Nocardia salmonicida]
MLQAFVQGKGQLCGYIIDLLKIAVSTEVGMGRKSRVDGSPDRSDRPEISSFRSSRNVDSGNGSGAGSDTNGDPSFDIFPLTAAQRGIWFAQHLAESSPISVAQYVEIVGELDTELLAEACRTASREFESGHMRLIEVDGEPCQFVDAEHGALVSILDLRHHADPVATAHSMMVQDYSAPLDVLNDHLVTAIVFQVGEDHFLWYQRAHHIALDGFAAVTMLHRMTELYNAWVKGEEPPSCAAQDLGVIVEQDLAYRGSTRFDNDRRYWLEHLEGAPPAVSLAGRVGKPTIHPALVSTELPDATASLMESVALEHGQSVAPTIVAAFAAYLARMTGSDEVMLSLPVSGRHSAVLRRSGGMVANVVPLRVRVAGRSVGELIAAVQSELTSALRRQRYRQEDIFHDMGIARDEAVSFGPAVNLMMIENEVVLGNTTGRLNVLTSGPTADLFVNIYPGAGKDSTHIDFQGNPSVYSQDELTGHHRRFRMFLHEFLAGGAGCPVSRLSLLDAQERSALPRVRGPSGVETRLLPEILTESARRDPGACAIISAGQTMTYGELDTRSSQLARHLRALGCGPDTAVAIMLRRSVESVVATWAVAKCGAAFVMVDPEYPRKRVEHMVADSGAAVAITVDALRGRLPSAMRSVVLDDPATLGEGSAASAPMSEGDMIRPLRPSNIAYITYTSGSTGAPKGVQVTHTGLANLVADRAATYGIDTTSRVSYALSPSFDAAMEQFLTCFASGSTLVIVPPEVTGGEPLTRLLADEHVTHLTLTPTMLATVDPHEATDLRVVVVGGDVCPPHVIERWAPSVSMYNEYGPTEATVTAVGAMLTPDHAHLVGGPIRGVSAMVLDRTLQPVPKGTAGELYLAGPGLARGYSHLFVATAARFVADPYGGPGERMYRTGDIARWTGDNAEMTLELAGRSDFQVKIRGYRIEPGEIDAVLTTHEDVDLSVTVPVHNNAGTTVLASYVVPVSGRRIEPLELERFAQDSLAPHMVPAVILPLDRLPVNAFGKLDRGALPKPEFGTAPVGRTPATAREKAVAKLFTEVLGVPLVGADDSFFALGGDSILSIRLVARAKGEGLSFSTQDVFVHKTVAALAAAATATQARDTPELDELPGGGVGPMPLSPIMCAMLDRGHYDRFAQAALVQLPEGVDRAGLVRALGALLDRHDLLRAVLRGDSGDRYVEVLEREAVDPDAVLIDVRLDRRDAAEVDRHLQQAADRLDPAEGVLVRAVWMRDRNGSGPDLMWLVVHHLAVDVVSWRIILADLAQAWTQVSDGGEPDFGPITTSFRRWAHGLVERAPSRRSAELDGWKDVLARGDQLLGSRRLVPDRDVGATAGRVHQRIPAAVTEAVLTTIPDRFHCSANDPLLAALVLALGEWRRRRGTAATAGELISLEGHGREEQAVPGADLSGTVGWFTTRFPVRIEWNDIDLDDALAGGTGAGTAIKQVKEQLRAVPGNGIGYQMLRHLDPQGRAELADLPEPQISFNYLGRVGVGERSVPWAPTTEFTALTATSDREMALPALLDINAIAEEGRDGLELDVTWEFASQVLDREDVDELAGLWARALGALAEHVRSDTGYGFTPSDFPLTAVAQDDVDRWLGEYPSMIDVWPLTALQSGLLFHTVYDRDGDDGYIVQVALTFAGQVDGPRMRRAAQVLIDRHDSLRTAFVESADGPRQIVLRDTEVDWGESSIADIIDADRQARALRRLATAAAAPFDPAHPPLVRFHLVRTGVDTFQLLVTNHHLVLDGWSMPLLIHELLSLYISDGDTVELAPPRSYREYLQWLQAQDRDAAIAAWRETLAGIDSPTRVTDRPDRSVTAQVGEVDLKLDAATTAALLDLGRSHGVTANTALQVAWALLVAALTGRSDVVFGNTIAHRPPQIPDVERMVGLLVNTLPVRVRLEPGETVGELLVRVQSEQAAMLDHQYVGLAELQRATGITDMFDTATVLESYPLDRELLARNLSDAGLRFVDIDAHDATPYPLSLQVSPPRSSGDRRPSAADQPGTYTVALKFAADRFDADEVRTLLERFELLLTQIVGYPTRKVAAISSCWDSERAELLSVGREEPAAELVLRDILWGTARKCPDAVAVRSGDATWTYQELERRADGFARLLADHGARAESIVALAVPRSAELVVAIWAVAKTGAAFLPLDPGNPAARIEELLSDSRTRLGVTTSAVAPQLPNSVDWLTLDASASDAQEGRRPSGPPAGADRLSADNAAYVIYTSGSTGKPKAVHLSHRGLADLVAAQVDAFGVGTDSVVLQVASPGFDACLSELLLAHGSGAALVVAPPEVYAGTDLEDLIRAQRVSHAIITPSVLKTMDPSRTPSLTSLAVVGEATEPDTVNRWGHGRRLMNHYGPTECTIWATGSEVVPGEPVTIGGPIPGASAMVLDTWLRPVPVGVVGELYIGGPGLARGYVDRRGVTASHFVADPRSTRGERIYRTGDSVRWVRGRAGLALEYLGRGDQQVKIHGLRIEPGEIDAHLAQHPEVASVATVVVKGPADEPILVSYFVSSSDATIDVAALGDDLSGTLPRYMNPAAIVQLEEMPRTPTGKLDRKQLRQRAFESDAAGGRTPSTRTEQVVAKLFAEVLHLDTVSADSNFFALGGDSIVSMRLVALARSAGLTFTPRDVFEGKTVAALAAMAGGDPVPVTDRASDSPLVALAQPDLARLEQRYHGLSDVWPLSPMQSGVHFHSTFDPDAGDNYTVQTMIGFSGAVDGERLRRAAQAVVDRHDILRAAFVETAAGPCQIVLDHAEIGFREIDLGDAESPADPESIAAADAAAGFDLSAAPLLRLTLIRLDAGSFRLLVTNHHVILDGWSMPLLMRELLDYYGSPDHIDSAGPAPSYRDYLSWLGRQDSAASKAAWKQAFSDVDAPTRVSRDVGAAGSVSTAEIGAELTADLFGDLRRVAAEAAVTLNTAVTAAWALNLRVLTGETDVIFGSAVSGRPPELPLVDQTLGMFLTTIPVRVPLEPTMTVRALLTSIQARHAGMLDHHHIGLPEIHRSVGLPELFDTAITFQSFPVDRTALQRLIDSAGLRVDELSGVDATPYPLSLVVEPKQSEHGEAQGLRITLRFHDRAFDTAAARRILDRFVELLGRIAVNPDVRLGELPLGEEPGPSWPDSVAEQAIPDTLDRILAARAAAEPDAIAVRCGDTAMTYRQLDERSAQLARVLLRHGVRRGQVVAAVLPRSLAATLALWAVAKTGAAFLPIDPTLPSERIEYLLSDSGTALGLTDTFARERLPDSVEYLILDQEQILDAEDSVPAGPITDAERDGPIRRGQTAYVSYTSGSTGMPKGVLVSHRGLADIVAAQRRILGVDPMSVVLQVASPSFDASVFELLMAHGSGGRLVVSPADVYAGPELADLIGREHISHAVITPSALATISCDGLDGLRVLATAGEPVGPELVDRWAPHRTMVNLYGPSESTIWATASGALTPGAAITIGKPVGPVAVVVLDTWLRPVPHGVEGELYLFGAGLADGYAARRGLTAARFVACPFAEPGQRMYRTGDVVRRGADGDLEFLGRNDFQVKVHGTRVELGEIDAVLDARADVAYAVTVPRRDGGHPVVLVSYVVPAPGAEVSGEELRAALAEVLPRYTVPSAVMVLDEVPLTVNGKLDRERLPEPVAVTREFRAPSPGLEELVARTFEQVLDVDQVGVDDDFFALGGDSLSASMVVARIGAALDARVPVRSVFEAPTVGGLAGLAAAASGGGRLPLLPGVHPDSVPLSLAQQRMWFLNRFEPDSAVHNIPVMLRLSGRLDTEALGAALADVVARHEVLRTIYPEAAGEPRQVVLDEPAVPVRPVRVHADSVPEVVGEFVRGGFDVTARVPMRVGLFELGAEHDSDTGEFLLVLVVHHIAGDGQSMGPLARDVMVAYVARLAGQAPEWEPLAVQYADYAWWQRQMLGAADDPASLMSQQVEFWRSTLEGAPDRLELPADRPRPAVASLSGDRVPVEIGARLHERLVALARSRGSSLFMVMHAALATVLGRLSGSDDVVIGTPVAGRGEPGLDDLVGMFVNTLALRTRVDTGEPFAELLMHTRETDLLAFEHADVPFERVVEELNPERSAARHPLFQVALAFQNVSTVDVVLPDVRVTRANVDTGAIQFDLQLVLADSSGNAGAAQGMSGMLTYARDLFDEATAAAIVRRLVRVLEAVADDPAVVVGDIDWLEADERSALTSRVGARTVEALEPPALLPEVLTSAVRDNGDGIAVVAGDATLSYKQLDERSNRLARLLIRRGAGPENPVLVAAARSTESVVAWWAVVRSGAAYVPVDPRYPEGRIEQMVSDSRATLGITVSSVRAQLPDSVDWIVLDDPAVATRIDAAASGPIGDDERTRPLRVSDVAYVVFTSGSTGVPKGVAVTHSGIADFVSGRRADRGLQHASRVLHFASPSFDAALMEILMAVSRAGALIVAPTGIYGGGELAEFLRVQRITHAFMTPAALASVDSAGLDDLRLVMSGGEEVPTDLVSRWAGTDVTGAREFQVLYGPTEATMIATATRALQPDDRPTIGAPLPGMQALVLDARLQPVPVGVAGELYLAGPALARGYLNKPATDAARFVAHPFGEPGRRMYRTGDVVRWNTDGELEFLGRNDFQVKIRGYRVELGEIDAVLSARAEVAYAVTVPWRAGTGPAQLVSYAVPETGASLSGEQLRAALVEALPSYLVPAAVMILDAIPLLPNGKLDRTALPAPVVQAKRFRALVSPAEEIVAGVFADVLGIDGPVGADDDFFDLGGNSLVATRVAARIGAALEVTIPVSVIFEAPTVERLAARAESQADTGRVALTAQPRPERIPLSSAQQRMWFLNRLEPGSAAYSIPIVLRLSGRLDVDALRAAIEDVVNRHEVLRTVYPYAEGAPSQVVLPAARACAPITVTSVAEPELEESLSAFVSTVFDVTVEAPLRVRLFELGPNEWVLAVVVHHIACDGSSLGPLARDMMTAYTAHLLGETPSWLPLPVQYADYAIWQRTVLGAEDDPESLLRAQIDYWTLELAELPVVLGLPTDRPRPPVQTHAGASVPLTVGADLHAGLQQVARAHNTTLFMVFHAALAATLARLADTDDIAIGTPFAGRGEPELDDLVGMFVNTLVLRTRLTPGMTFTQLLEYQRGTDLAAFGHADVPFERLVQELNPVRSHAHHPLFQVMLAFQNVAGAQFELPGLSASAMTADADIALFDLLITMSDSYDSAGDPAGLSGAVIYASDLFDATTATAIVDRLLRVLDALVTDSAQPVREVDLLGPDERETILTQWNSTDHNLDPGETLASVFAHAARAHADRPAVTAGEQTLTYAEFASRVHRLARWLISSGVGPESLVALRMRRSLDQVVAIYAVHAAGGGYVPVDPDLPADRIAYMLSIAAPVLELSSLEGLELSGFDDGPVTDADRLAPLRSHNVAYVIFTSGSTGRPKGVAVSHCSVVNQMRWVDETYGLTPNDVVLQKSPATFDMSVWELFAAPVVGARLVIARAYGHTDPAYLAETIAAQRVTFAALVPSMLAVLADTAPAESLESLRTLLVGGEAFGPETVAAARRIVPGVELHNLYGPTECTVCSTAHRVTETESGNMPIGSPVWNTRAYVLDDRLHPVPVGVAGELYLAGTQLARGYQSRPGLTAERFVPDPYGDGLRLYRTGDLVRWRRTGELEYLGRTDFQVKLRGLRIELGEIEAVLAEHPSIARAIAVVRPIGVMEHLVAYVVPAAGATVDTVAVSAHAATKLPDYMVPATLTVLDTVPLHTSGKLDPLRLPEPVLAVAEFREPSSWLEGEVARAFGTVLGVDRVGADDDFYALGGNSLKSVQVVSELRKELDYEVPISWMLSDPCPADLAKRIESRIDADPAADGTDAGFDTLLPIRTSGERAPLFCIHPALGLSWCYRTLDRYLSDDRPIYGIQAPQISGEIPGPTTIEEMAARYFAEIRAVAPHGPYHLLGWSLGGAIAHAIAVEMRAAGEEVALLALLDAEVGGVDESTLRAVTAGELISNLGPVMGVDFVSPDASAEEAADLIERHLGSSLGIDAARIQRLTDAYNLAVRAAGAWHPAVLDSDALYFTATRERRSDATGHEGWARVVRGQLSNFDIDVAHLDMTQPGAIAEIARILNARLDS